jgi:hypothetical protein
MNLTLSSLTVLDAAVLTILLCFGILVCFDFCLYVYYSFENWIKKQVYFNYNNVKSRLNIFMFIVIFIGVSIWMFY